MSGHRERMESTDSNDFYFQFCLEESRRLQSTNSHAELIDLTESPEPSPTIPRDASENLIALENDAAEEQSGGEEQGDRQQLDQLSGAKKKKISRELKRLQDTEEYVGAGAQSSRVKRLTLISGQDMRRDRDPGLRIKFYLEEWQRLQSTNRQAELIDLTESPEPSPTIPRDASETRIALENDAAEEQSGGEEQGGDEEQGDGQQLDQLSGAKKKKISLELKRLRDCDEYVGAGAQSSRVKRRLDKRSGGLRILGKNDENSKDLPGSACGLADNVDVVGESSGKASKSSTTNSN